MPIEIVHSKTAEQTFISHFASYEANIVAM